jgi:PKD repeat protein
MKRSLLALAISTTVLILLLLLMWSVLSPATAAPAGLEADALRDPQATLVQQPVTDAQSTTGPQPPPGVDVPGNRSSSPHAVVIPGVPAYDWHHGCGPTAAGMVIGYWDGRGFDALVPGSAATHTPAVSHMIASEGPASNYTDYALPLDCDPYLRPDKSEPPVGDEHPDDCVADFMKTSQSYHSNCYGWSWFSPVGPAMESYVHLVGPPAYHATSGKLYMGSSLTWDSFRAEIDAGRPLVLLVDTGGDGRTDHFVTAVGYDVVEDTLLYGCRDTWHSVIRWEEFAPMARGQPWGIWGGITLRIERVPTAVEISGPASGTVDTSYRFTATVSPVTSTLPITYVWQVAGRPPDRHTGDVRDTQDLSWGVSGPQEITVTAIHGQSAVSATHTITLRAPPRAGFTAWPTKGLPSLTVAFTNTSRYDYDASLWSFGDGTTSTLESPTHTYGLLGVYSVTLTVSGLDGTDTLTRPRWIQVVPVLARFTAAPTRGQPPLTVTFTNTSVGSYTASLWNFGDGLTSTLASPTHTYTSLGRYAVRLTLSATDGQDSMIRRRYIAVWEPCYLPLVLHEP